MRFDTPVYFQKLKSVYDPDTGNYTDTVEREDERFASVTNTGEDSLKLFYGSIKQGSFVLRLQNGYTAPFDRIKIGDKFYCVDFSRTLRQKQTFVVSEVQSNADNRV